MNACMIPSVRNPSGQAQHRPATGRRVSKDSIVALDMFSGAGGSSQGITAAGIDVWYAANHWEYAVNIHEANHPEAEHFIADLVDVDAADYYHPEQLPAADVVWASPSCTSHSQANARKAYARNLSLFDVYDPDWEDRVTHSERSRATAVCVLQYARRHRPKVIIVENVVEFAQWGPAVGNTRRGDGATYSWWLAEFEKLGYRYKELWLNSMFFPPTPQSRDRMYVVMWDRTLPTPDLEHRPESWCPRCDQVVQAVQAFKPRKKTWPRARWGKYQAQYVYGCPSCGSEVTPPAFPAASAIDFTDLGPRIGDRDRPLAKSTMDRIERGLKMMREFPVVMVPAGGAGFGPGPRSAMESFATQTGRQEQAMLSAFQAVVAGNTFEREGSACRIRGMDEVMWTQHATAATAMVSAFLDDYQGRPRGADEPIPTQTATETLGVAGVPMVVTNRTNNVPKPVTDPMAPFMLSPIFAKQNGGPADTAWHTAATDPLNTATGVDTTAVVRAAPGEWVPPTVEEARYRMLTPEEIRAGMGIEPTFQMWGTNRDKVRALGNGVTPPVAEWICQRVIPLLGR